MNNETIKKEDVMQTDHVKFLEYRRTPEAEKIIAVKVGSETFGLPIPSHSQELLLSPGYEPRIRFPFSRRLRESVRLFLGRRPSGLPDPQKKRTPHRDIVLEVSIGDKVFQTVSF